LRGGAQLVGVEARRPATSTKRMVDRAGHLEDDPGVAPLLPAQGAPRALADRCAGRRGHALRRRGVEAI
jgi:hypothetical protein